MPFCLHTGKSVGGGDIRAVMGTPHRVMISHWYGERTGDQGDIVVCWQLDADDTKGELRDYHASALGLSWVKPSVVQPWRPRRTDPKVDIDLTYDKMLERMRQMEWEERRREREFEQRVEARAREMFEGMLSQDRPEARAIRL